MSTWKRILPILLLTLLLLPSCPGPALADMELTQAEREWLDANRDNLILWYDGKFPPIEFQGPSGDFDGLGADVMRLIENELGVTFRAIPSRDWSGQLKSLESGESAIAPVIVRNPERERYAFFSAPYINIPVVIITTREKGGNKTLDDFRGLRVAAVKGYASEGFLRDNYTGSFEIVPVPNIQEGLRDVSFGVVDALVGNLAVTAYYIEQEKLPNLRVAGATKMTYPISFAVSRKYPLLFSSMQKALSAVNRGEIDAAVQKWIHLEQPGVLNREEVRLIKVGAAFLLTLLLSLGFVSWLLKRRLREKVANLDRIERELRDKSERLELALTAINAGIWDFFPATGKAYYSPQWCTMLGYGTDCAPQTFEGWAAFAHPDDVAGVNRILMDYITQDGRGEYEAEFRMSTQDGGWRWILGKGRTVEWDAEGRPTRIIGLNLDIHKLKEAQEARRKSEALSRAILDQAFALIALLDSQGRILNLNRTALDFVGAPLDGLMGRPFWEGAWWPDRSEGEAVCREGMRKSLRGEIFRREVRHLGHDGEERIIDFSISPFMDETGAVRQFICEGRDVTEMRRARDAVAESERRFRTIFENAPYSIAINRLSDGAYLDVNNAFLEKNRLSMEEALKLTSRDFAAMSSEDEAEIQRRIREAGGVHNIEAGIRQRDGSVNHIIYSAVPITVGGELCALSMTVDVTDKKRAEEALRASEEKYRAIFNNAPIGIFRTTFQGRFVEANPTLARMLGYSSRDDLLNSVHDIARDLYPNAAMRRRLLDAVLASPSGASLEIEFKRKTGEPFHAIIHASLQLTPEGEPAFLDGTIEDISERKRAEEALRASEEKFSRLFRLSPDSIMLLHLQSGRLADVNDAFAQLTGYSREEALGQNALELRLYRDPAARERLYEHLAAGDVVKDFEFELQRKDGDPVLCSLSCQVLAINEQPYLMAVMRDVTEIKKMQEMMIQTEKMISVGGIAAGIAHEINNPLGIVLQAAQNLVQRTRPDFPKNLEAAQGIGLDMNQLAEYMRARKLDVFLEDIQSAAQRASAIIRHMLDFSRRSESKRKVCHLDAIVEKALSLAQTDYDLKKSYDFKQIKVEIDMDDDLPAINCTETEIEQVLLNLLRNSAQAMAEAEPPQVNPRIAVRVKSTPDGVRLEVEDNGPGMPPEVRRRIFEPFFTTKAPGVGTGLGLSVSYFIVTKGHGGRMKVASTPGVGTTFTIELPTDEALRRAGAAS